MYIQYYAHGWLAKTYIVKVSYFQRCVADISSDVDKMKVTR